MDRIGILTFHRTTNFGSYLQTYGLYKKIQDLGYECEIIDYRCPAVEERENLARSNKKGLRNFAKRILLQPALDRKAKSLSDFSSEYMRFSESYNPNNIINANNSFDKFIVGSDIVWGIDITGCDLNYFLAFAEDSKKKFAFSASVGNETNAHSDEIKPLLNRFDKIAVREKSAADWVRRISDKSAEWVCDPTMLLTVDEWKNVIPVEQIERDYVLVYFSNPGKKAIRDAIKYARENNKKVLYINYGLREKDVVNIKPKSLNEFVSYIAFADHVFTASYHGMLFSLYFEKELTFYTRDHASRMISLSERLGIQEQLGDNKSIENYFPIDYSLVDKKISDFRDDSIRVLSYMLDS